MSDSPITTINGFDIFISVQPVIVGYNRENADMTYPNGEVYGRLYSVSAICPEGSYLLSHHEGFRDAGLEGAVSDVAFYSNLPNFNPALVGGHQFESSESSYDWAY